MLQNPTLCALASLRYPYLQELLGDAVSTDDDLLSRDRETLLSEFASLQARLRHRDA